MVLANSYKIEQYDPEVLREYDIRGIVGKNLTANTAYSIGRTFGHIVCVNLSTKKIAVGYDGRLTSPFLHQALCSGLVESGAEVYSIGMCPTPMAYFAHYHLKTDAVVMVTGSHNPPNYNGFKMLLKRKSIVGKDILNIANISLKGKFCKDSKGIKIKKSITNHIESLVK